MMKHFKNISEVIKSAREEANVTQLELATELNYKNGQYISNLERALCSLPIKKVKKASKVLNIEPERLTNALLMDYQTRLKSVVK